MIRQTSERTKFHKITQKVNAIEILRYSLEKNNSTHNASPSKSEITQNNAHFSVFLNLQNNAKI